MSIAETKAVMIDLIHFLRAEEDSKIVMKARQQKKEADDIKTVKKREMDSLIAGM